MRQFLAQSICETIQHNFFIEFFAFHTSQPMFHLKVTGVCSDAVSKVVVEALIMTSSV